MNCENCLHKKVCKWMDLKDTLIKDYDAWRKTIKATYVSDCPVGFSKDPLVCKEFSRDTSIGMSTIDGCDTCKYEDRSSCEAPCTGCKYNNDESVISNWEAKDGE